MRREGSAFAGLGTVFVKELSDNISSVRMLVLELLVVLTALAALYGAIDSLRQTTAEDPFLLLRLFTLSREPAGRSAPSSSYGNRKPITLSTKPLSTFSPIEDELDDEVTDAVPA